MSLIKVRSLLFKNSQEVKLSVDCIAMKYLWNSKNLCFFSIYLVDMIILKSDSFIRVIYLVDIIILKSDSSECFYTGIPV